MSVIAELFLKISFPIRYEREFFNLSDGGTIAIDWAMDSEGGIPKDNFKRPILCCFAGIGGGNDNMYLYSMIKEARERGYKCCVVNFRGCAGVKLTSPHVYWLTTWKLDIQEPLEYIFKKYCSTKQKKTRNLYAYSVSLGAGMLTCYLIESGEKCVLSGALPYGLFFNYQNNVPFFK